MTRILFFIFSFLPILFMSQAAGGGQVVTPKAGAVLRFTENAGQWPGKILFRAQLDGGALFLEQNCLTFNFYDKKRFRQLHHGLSPSKKDYTIKGHAYKVHFRGANPEPLVVKEKPGEDYENFFIGSDPAAWKSGVRNYQRLWLKEIYKGIDYELLTAAGGIKYNFIVKPGADPAVVQLVYEGVEDLRLHKGTLVAKLNVNEVIEQQPYAYQLINGEVRQVECRYSLKSKVLGFEFPRGYDSRYELVIDPVLVFAAQSGSTADNFGMTATFDAQGNLYAGGIVYSAGYPVTTGAYSASFLGPAYYGNTDVVVTKYNSTGTSLLYSTYLGGYSTETVHSMIVDNNNNLCIYGVTSSPEFPVTSSAYDKSFNGGPFLMFVSNGMRFNNGTDIYITKFNASGTSILASTFLGGTGNDGLNHSDHYSYAGQFQTVPVSTASITVYEPVYDSLLFNYGDQCRGEIQVDAYNNIYVASSTRSSNFPVVNSFDNTLGGMQDGVVCKFNSTLSSLLYSSFIGGSSADASHGLIVLPNLQVYVTGGTSSSNFPHCAGGYQSAYQGGKADGYVIRISSAGNTVLNGTFFGTAQYDQSFFVQADKYNNIYLYGQSLGNVPVLKAPNATTVFSVAGTHQFISRFNASLSTLNLSTRFGNLTNAIDISPSAFSVDKCNNIYLSGWGGNILTSGPALNNMPLLQATQSSTDGFDFYFMGLDSNAAALKYGSYFGGGLSREHVDGGTSRFDPLGKIYQSVCAGCQGHDDFPVTPGAWPGTAGNPNHSSNCNNGVIKLDFQLQLAIATIKTNTLSGCTPVTVTFTNATPPTGTTSTYLWYLGNGSTSSTNISPTITYTTPGTYSVALVVRDAATCNKRDSSITYVTVFPKPAATISVNASPCSNTIALSQTVTGSTSGLTYTWNFGNSSPVSTVSAPSYTYPANGSYNITFTVSDVNGCRDTRSAAVSVYSFVPAAGASTNALCSGASVTLTGSGGSGYTWTPGGSGPPVIVVSPTSSTVYSLQVQDNTPGYTCSRTLTVPVTVYQKPAVLFNVGGTPCTNTVSTTNSSTGNFGTAPYTWDFGDGSAAETGATPSHTYAADGIYSVSLTVTDVNGCRDARTQTVAVLNFQPGVAASATICNGETAALSAFGGTSYSWSPAASLNNAALAGPLASPSVTTLYSVSILNTSYGFSCTSAQTAQVWVNPRPTANFSYTMNPCGGGVSFFDKSEEEALKLLWQLGATRTETVVNPYHFFKTGGSHTVVLVVTNEFGCSGRKEEVLTVLQPPPLSISAGSNICIGQSIQLEAGGGIAYDWQPPATLDNPASDRPLATPTTETQYSVNITTSQLAGGKPCTFMLTTDVIVDRLGSSPVRAYATPVTVLVGEPTTLVYVGEQGAMVSWFPLNSTSPTRGYTVTAHPRVPTTYTAVAVKGACRELLPVTVDALTPGCTPEDAFVPNTFTPNGDGENDVFRVQGIKISELYFAVYNRWGEKVFETTDRLAGWDGRFKGKDADVGVFGYYLKVKCSNGAETMKKGNVTLIR